MAESNTAPIMALRSKEEVALELMRFIVESTGYGKGASAAGFTGKSPRNPEEQADALLQLYDRCRGLLHKDPS